MNGMRIEQGDVTYRDIGYDVYQSRGLGYNVNFVAEKDSAGGDLSGLYPRPIVKSANADFSIGNDLTVAGDITVTGDITVNDITAGGDVAVTGDTDITGDLTADDATFAGMMRQGETWHAYGGFQDQSVTITTGTVNTWYHVTNATNDLWTAAEADGFSMVDDVLTATNAGDYAGIVSLTISGTANKDFELRVYNVTDSVIAGYHIGVTTTGAGNYANVTLPFYLEADASTQFRLEIRCTTNPTANPTLQHAIFYMSYLHDHTTGPSASPSLSPSISPSLSPSVSPSLSPSISPSVSPTA